MAHPDPALAVTTVTHHRARKERDGSPITALTPFFVATAAVAFWITCFATGAIINSEPYRDYLNSATIPTQQDHFRDRLFEATIAKQAQGSAQTAAAAAATGPANPSGAQAYMTRDEVAALLKTQAPPPDTKVRTLDVLRTRAAIDRLLSFDGIFALLVVLLTFTPPNLAILSALAAVAGAAGRWMTDGTTAQSPTTATGEAIAGLPFGGVLINLHHWASGVLVGALVRGFFVYLALLSGLLILTGDPFDNPSPGQYVRLAGTVSLFCFIVGWQPNVLAGLIGRFINVMQSERNAPRAASVASSMTSVTSVTSVTAAGAGATAAATATATEAMAAISTETKSGQTTVKEVKALEPAAKTGA